MSEVMIRKHPQLIMKQLEDPNQGGGWEEGCK